MRALLLAAGTGTRLRPLTETVPKCLVPINGRPLLDYWLDLVFTAEYERVLINTHYLPDQVCAHVAASPWRSRVDLVHEPSLLGTAGTVRANRDYFGGDSFLLAHADNLTDVDLRAFAARHADRPADTDLTMLAYRTDMPQTCGILEVADDGRLTGFHEKVVDPPGNLANAAVYMASPAVTEAIARIGRPVVDLSTEVIPQFIGRTLVVEHRGYHRDIGSPESLALACAEFPKRRPARRNSAEGET